MLIAVYKWEKSVWQGYDKTGDCLFYCGLSVRVKQEEECRTTQLKQNKNNSKTKKILISAKA